LRYAKSLLRGRRFRSRRLPPPWPGNLNYRGKAAVRNLRCPGRERGKSPRTCAIAKDTQPEASRCARWPIGQRSGRERRACRTRNGMPPMASTQSSKTYDMRHESLGTGDSDGRQGGRHADTTRIRGFRVMRDLRNYGVCCYCSVGPRCAARSDRRRHAKDLIAEDGPMPGYVTVLVEAIIEPGVPLGRHTHPGIESAYVLEGGFELPIQGQPTRTLKVGDAFQIPPETPHAGGKPGDAKSRILITYVVEKGKPLASPA
jgi:quercetin dioxygenase-like cupin family protein